MTAVMLLDFCILIVLITVNSMIIQAKIKDLSDKLDKRIKP